VARVNPGEFIRQVRAETAKVVWASRKQTLTTALMVIIMTSILGLFFLGVDRILGSLVHFLLSLAKG
jgi:preprotein translocase subunit SecE